jgi:hypothetical protein
MQKFPGKLDCTRNTPNLRSQPVHIHAAYLILVAIFFCIVSRGAQAQAPLPLPQYPEVAYLARSSYCNPYFGFRFNFPAGFKSESIFLPVQPHDRHILLAMHLQRLDRAAEVYISAFHDNSENPARLAAKVRAQQAHKIGLDAFGPNSVSVHGHDFYRLHILGDPRAIGVSNESSFFLLLRGYVVHIAIFSHEKDLAAPIESAIEHLEFVEPGESACTVAPLPAAMASPEASAQPAPEPAHIYYGPALPTDLVESTLRDAPGRSVPSGDFSRGIFTEPALGVRIVLPSGWQELPADEAYRVTELMRDPTSDPESSDRRRALFRACSKVVFAAADPETEPLPQLHPGLAVVAMPQGCVPDMVLPPARPASAQATQQDRDAAEDLATVLVRSLGVLQLGHGSIRINQQGRQTFNLDGTMPYHVPGEILARRLDLRVSATASGPWFMLIYSVTPSHTALHNLESHISIGIPDSAE